MSADLCVVCFERPRVPDYVMCFRCVESLGVRTLEPDIIRWAAERSRRFERARASKGGAMVRVRAPLIEALEPFVRQAEEFIAGQWDAADWPAALDALTQMAKVGRDALGTATPTADAPPAAETEERCGRCDGCGRIANSDDGEPWTVWTAMPLNSSLAVLAGIVCPIPCPDCSGSGRARTPGSDR